MKFQIPMHTVSEANQREHWARKAERVAEQRGTIRLVCRTHFGAPPALPVVVCLTRVSPGTLDDDNLRASCKAVRDGIADYLGTNDRNPGIDWQYGQEHPPKLPRRRKGAPKAPRGPRFWVRVEMVVRHETGVEP